MPALPALPNPPDACLRTNLFPALEGVGAGLPRTYRFEQRRTMPEPVLTDRLLEQADQAKRAA